MTALKPVPAPLFYSLTQRLPGIALAALLAGAALILSQASWLAATGLGALTWAIVLGMLVGNTGFKWLEPRAAAGVDFSKQYLLRAGIVLFGFRITFQQIAQIGWEGVAMAVMVVSGIFVLATFIGTRLLKLDRETAMLVGAGSAICGAAAVLALAPVLRSPAHKVAVAVATVVVFGTLAMFIYPVLYGYLNLPEHAFGVFTGATIHEVAQVVAAGEAIGPAAATAAVVEKMTRVMLLAPFLLIVSWLLARTDKNADNSSSRVVIPWFAVGFVAASAINSLQWLPEPVVQAIGHIDTLMLAAAMAALGLRTHLGAIRQAGLRPLMLAGLLFGVLLLGGYTVSTLLLL